MQPAPSSPAPVSVLIPFYNAEAFLAEALESIRAQTLPVRQVIAIDDGSTDNSVEIAKPFPFVTIVRKEHGGIARTLNHGLEFATEEYLALLDADDRWLPGKISAQMSAFQADPSLEAVFGHTRRFRSIESPEGRIEQLLDVIPGLAKSCLLVKRSAFERIGRFSTSGEHDFLDWYLRATDSGLRTKMLEEVVTERRLHERNHGMVHRGDQRRTYLASLKANLDRRRSAQAAPSTGPGV